MRRQFAYQVLDAPTKDIALEHIQRGTIFEGELAGENHRGLYLRVQGGLVNLVDFSVPKMVIGDIVYNFVACGEFQATGV